MSAPRERIFLLLAANLVLTVLVVAAGITLFTPKPESGAPTSGGGTDSRLEERVDSLDAKVTGVGETIASLRTRVATLEAENARLRAAGGAAAAAGPGAPGAAPAPKTDAERFAETFGAMMKQQIARQRDRFINDIVNPSEESAARSEREVRRMAEQATRGLDLGPRDTAEVTRILTEVDRARRERLRRLFTSKPKPEDVTYPEIKEVLDDSFEEEDRMIQASLPADKAEQYQESAAPMRNFVYIAASTAFPGGTDEGR